MVNTIQIGNTFIGSGQPCFFIAEAGVNHNGSIDMALELVEVAAKAGADAVKFQTFKADKLVTKTARKAAYQKAAGGDESQFDMLRRLELSVESHRTLQKACREKGILFLSSPFDEESAAFLSELNVPALKVASGELTNLPFLRSLCQLKVPLLISTGMSTLAEVGEAVQCVSGYPETSFALLHCVSNYPAKVEHANLRAMETMRREFGVPIGYSDHTLGIDVCIAAAALGATIIEKHFTLDKDLPGPDHRCSLSPAELAALVRGVRDVQSALGDGIKKPQVDEAEVAEVARKSVVAALPIEAGQALKADLLEIKRPGTGIPPKYLERLYSKIARRRIEAGELINWSDLN